MAKIAKRENPQREQRATRLSRASLFPLSVMEGIDQLFGRRTPWRTALSRAGILRMPPVDVYEEGEAVVVKAELPGLKKEEVDIQIAGDVVTISGKKEKEEKVEKKDYYRYERESGSFSRSVALPAKVQAEKATAELKDGVLLLRAPKAEGVATSSLKIDVT